MMVLLAFSVLARIFCTQVVALPGSIDNTLNLSSSFLPHSLSHNLEWPWPLTGLTETVREGDLLEQPSRNTHTALGDRQSGTYEHGVPSRILEPKGGVEEGMVGLHPGLHGSLPHAAKREREHAPCLGWQGPLVASCYLSLALPGLTRA